MVKDCINNDNECKYFHHEPYYTPNNYDVFFDYNSIPVNIPVEKPYDFRNRLQKLMPLTKIIHLNMDTDTFEEDNNIHLHTRLRLNYQTIEESTETQLKITGVWDDLIEGNQTSKVTYEISYLLDENSPVVNAKIRLVNVYYPLKQYTGTTNSDGRCVFEDLPYGSYVQQILIAGYSIPLTTVEINEEEIVHTLLIGSNEESDDTIGTSVQLNFYRNGLLILSDWSYDEGNLSTANEEQFKNGELNINVDEVEYDDSTTILIDSPGFDEINDFTEFEVNIIGDDTVMDTVSLNLLNNYTRLSRRLPLYNSAGDEIEYSLSFTQPNCDVGMEYVDIINYNDNEVVLL